MVVVEEREEGRCQSISQSVSQSVGLVHLILGKELYQQYLQAAFNRYDETSNDLAKTTHLSFELYSTHIFS